jgi:hypothetical protein
MQPSFSVADEAEIQLLIGQGYPRMVAIQMYVQKGRLGGLSDVVIESNNNSAKLSSANSLSYSRSQTPTPSGERVITAADFGDTRGYKLTPKHHSPVREQTPTPPSPMLHSQQWSPPPSQSPMPTRNSNGFASQQDQVSHSPAPLSRHGSAYESNREGRETNNYSNRDYSAQPQAAPIHPSLPRRPSGLMNPLDEDATKQVLRQRRPSATSTTMIGTGSRDNWDTQSQHSTHSFQSSTSRSVLLVPERLPPAHTVSNFINLAILFD